MAQQHSTLVEQVRALLTLTQTEAQIAQTRTSQARTEAVRRELAQNAENAHERARLLGETLRDLGGVPDVVSPALGRIVAILKTGAEQAEPLSEALLQDLQLEHNLVDRARYLKVLSQAAERSDVELLADRLVEAHSATVEWLTTVLAEEALGGPAALRSTPLQKVAGTATKAAILPTRIATESVNRYVDLVRSQSEKARERVVDLRERVTGKAAAAASKAERLGDDVRDVATAGRDASLKRAEQVAEREGNAEAADAAHEARRKVGALEPVELPIVGYDQLAVQQAAEAVKTLQSADEIRAIVDYEEAHKNRSSVVSAAQTRLAAIAKEAAGVS